MASNMLLALLGSLAIIGLAGCTAGSGASVDFDGEGNGVDSDEANCNSDGTVTGTGNIEDGELHVTVVDGDGKTVFEETYSGDIALEGRTLDGASGDWELTATRLGDDLLGDFNGQYTFRLDC